MAIPGIPQNFNVQTGNTTNLASWDLVPGATSYVVQRSLDNITYATVATLTGSPLAISYQDTAVTVGTQYFYKVKASNVDGDSSYTTPQAVVPAPAGEISLGALRLAAQQRADRINSNFVTLPEWNFYINQSLYELYDLLVTTYEDLYIAEPISFTSVAGQYRYALPNGSNTFQNQAGMTITPKALYKLTGVDMSLNTSQNAYITLNKFNFIDRNKYVYPTAGTTIYGIYNMQYRLIGSNIEFIPTPAANQTFQLWYVPRLTTLLKDTDTTDTSVSGWIQYVIIRAAKYALDKEESDTSKLDAELLFLKQRIEETAANRDAGQPDTISAARANGNGFGPGWSGSGAGW